MASEHEVVILGAGNAGLAAAGVARAAGQQVLVVEGRDVGGVCPLRGCVPKKVLVAAAQALDTIARTGTHQIVVSAHVLGWPRLVERKRTSEETIHTFALAIEKGIPASEIAERVYAYPSFHADLKYLVS